jgi:hypothetical protein
VKVDFSTCRAEIVKGHLKSGIPIRIFGCNWEEIKPYIRVIKSRRKGWPGHVICMRDDKCLKHICLVEGKDAFGRSRPV